MNANTVCTKASSGQHEWVYALAGEHCKACLLLRSTADGIQQTPPVPQPAVAPAQNIAFPPMPRVSIPSDLLDEILEKGKAKSAIIITFPEAIERAPFIIQNLHIATANVTLSNVKEVLRIVSEALQGKLGGETSVSSETVKTCPHCGIVHP